MVKATRKKTTKGKIKTTIADLEKNFQIARVELVKSADKNAAGLTAELTKLKNQVSKAQAKKQDAKNKRVAIAAKIKGTPSKTAKAQLKKAQVAYDAVNKAYEKAKAEFEAVNQQIKAVKLAQKKYADLSKTIDTFNKQWEKKVAKTGTKKRVTKRRKTSRKLTAKQVAA